MANFFRSVLLRLQNKSVPATTSNNPVTADTGYDGLGTVTITPQQHSGTYTPAANKSNNDMGAVHNNRYVNTSGMIVPSGNKAITANGTGIDVSGYATASVSVSPTLQTKSSAPNVSTNKDITPDSGYDGLSKVTITPLSHTAYYPSSSTNITSNGTSDLGANHNYRYVKVSVPNPTLSGNAAASDVKSGQTFYNSTYTKQTGTFAADTTNNSAAATTTAQTKSPASGKYFANFTVNPQQHSETYWPAANTSNNDMGAVHNKRYVDTSGMVIPSGDAAVGNVLSGKTFYNTSTTKQTGTMTNNGAVSKTLSASERSYTVPAGYHNGSGTVSVDAATGKKRWGEYGDLTTSVDVTTTGWNVSLDCGNRFDMTAGIIASGSSQGAIIANSLASQTGVDTGKTAIDASHVHSGYQGWVNGSKVSGTYTEPTIIDITPSSIPIELTDDVIYKAHKRSSSTVSNTAGYAIEGYSSVTPTSSGAQFSEGMVKMSDGGYAYSVKPSKTETNLYTNSAPTTAYSSGDVTLSQDIDNFDYLKFIAILHRTGAPNTEVEVMMSVSEFKKTKIASATSSFRLGWCCTDASKNYCFREMYYLSDTTLHFNQGWYIPSGSSTRSNSNNCLIPKKVIGIKYTGIQ